MASADDAADLDSSTPTAVAEGEVGSMGSLLRGVASTGAEATLAPGTLLGDQYRIERAVGRGGMGVVYLATDQRLGRQVAIKLGAARSSGALARLAREAAALAKLSHPNVVVVHQVGEHDQRVFLAMEYVDGGTAREWLGRGPRTWRAIVALYAAAGDGLAAAHAAGLIHRDFKPDNVLVGADQRPRVADFGLVRAIALAEDAGADPARTGDTGDTADLDATRVGAILGTPAYMPPEQLAGAEVDARADQFAFCASLWEALCGIRPFGGATPAAVKSSIESSAPALGEAGARVRGVPRHVLAALRRGLQPDRAARWPSVAALVAELRRDPAARRRRLGLVAGGAAVAVAIAVPLALRASRTPPPCTDSAAALAATWSPARAATLATALGAEWPALAPKIEAYARAWQLGHRDACRATRVARSQSEELLDRRMQCLGRARTQLDAVLTTLTAGTATARATAGTALEVLPELAACADAVGLASQAPLPTEPAARVRVDEAERVLAVARAAELDRGRLDPVAKATQALAAARASAWPPVLARALATHANILEEAGRSPAALAEFREAATVALAAGVDADAATSLADLAWALAVRARGAEAELALALARPLAERGGEPLVRRRVLGAAAIVATRAGRHDEAIAARRELIAMTARDPDAPSGWAASDQLNLATVLLNAGRTEEAVAAATAAVEVAEQVFGEHHPTVARYRTVLAASELNLGRAEPALALARRAQADLEAWYGPADAHLIDALETIGNALTRLRDPGAGAVLERAAALARAANLDGELARIQSRLAVHYVGVGQLDRAAASGAEQVRALEQTLGPSVGALVEPLLLVGYVAREQGHLADSRAAFDRALAIAETELGDDHPATHNLRVELGKTLVALGEVTAARDLLGGRAAALAGRTDLDPLIIVETHTVLADALWALGDRTAARAAIAVARKVVAAAPDRRDLPPPVEGWAAAHR
ncbi:MAG: serine/threonine protein kinase [Myxococcales bacterium]|nr:serine/threonine protein kinase [Myxococcales bacterium]